MPNYKLEKLRVILTSKYITALPKTVLPIAESYILLQLMEKIAGKPNYQQKRAKSAKKRLKAVSYIHNFVEKKFQR